MVSLHKNRKKSTLVKSKNTGSISQKRLLKITFTALSSCVMKATKIGFQAVFFFHLIEAEKNVVL